MSEPVTLEVLLFFVGGGASLVLGLALFHIRRDVRVENECRDEFTARRQELDAYKLEVAEKYATVSHLQEVEQRIMGELSTMHRAITGIGRDVNRLMGSHPHGGDSRDL